MTRGRRACRWLLALAQPALLAGCGDPPAANDTPRRVLDSTAAVEDTLYPSGTDAQRLLEFLRDRYGASARLDAPWQGPWDDTDVQAQRPVTRQVCARATIDTDGHVQHLLAVCQTLDDAASVEPGRVDLYVLRDGQAPLFGKDENERAFSTILGVDRPLLVIAQRLQGQYGRKGAPGTVQVDQLGPRRHAFRITHAGLHRGSATISRSYIAVHDDRLREVAVLYEHIDNRAATGCRKATTPCDAPTLDLDFAIAVGSGAAVAGYWPLTVRGRGQGCSGDGRQDHRLEYEPGTRRYAVPADLQREDCEG